jgi:hypothetical protein
MISHNLFFKVLKHVYYNKCIELITSSIGEIQA